MDLGPLRYRGARRDGGPIALTNSLSSTAKKVQPTGWVRTFCHKEIGENAIIETGKLYFEFKPCRGGDLNESSLRHSLLTSMTFEGLFAGSQIAGGAPSVILSVRRLSKDIFILSIFLVHIFDEVKPY